MASPLATATHYTDLKVMGEGAMPYVYGEVFSEDGWRARALSKKKFRMLKHLDAQLGTMLAGGERVTFVTWGMECSFWESYFLGIWAFFLNRRALVFTDRRLLLLQIDRRRRPLLLKSQVPYEAIRKVSRTRMGHPQLELRNGSVIPLPGIPRKDRKALQGRIERAGSAPPPTRAATGREHLCPHCFDRVGYNREVCPHCRKRFKSASRATMLSLLLPGLGDHYLGLRALGAVEMLAAIGVWAAALMAAQQGEPLPPPVLASGAGMLFVIVHGADALVTRHTAHKGLYPDG